MRSDDTEVLCCHHTSGAVQAELAVDTGDSCCAKWLSDNFCLVTSSYDNTHPRCARAFVHICSRMHIHHLRSEVWLWKIERFIILCTAKASVLQLHCLLLGLDSSFSWDSHSRQYVQHWPYLYFIYFHTLYKENETTVPVIIQTHFMILFSSKLWTQHLPF